VTQQIRAEAIKLGKMLKSQRTRHFAIVEELNSDFEQCRCASFDGLRIRSVFGEVLKKLIAFHRFTLTQKVLPSMEHLVFLLPHQFMSTSGKVRSFALTDNPPDVRVLGVKRIVQMLLLFGLQKDGDSIPQGQSQFVEGLSQKVRRTTAERHPIRVEDLMLLQIRAQRRDGRALCFGLIGRFRRFICTNTKESVQVSPLLSLHEAYRLRAVFRDAFPLYGRSQGT
jgi:hypothetical protein